MTLLFPNESRPGEIVHGKIVNPPPMPSKRIPYTLERQSREAAQIGQLAQFPR